MDEDLLAALRAMNDSPREREEYIVAPMPFVGSKHRSLEKLLPLLPYTSTWIDVCGGSGMVTLNRRPSKLEVYNDRHAGLVAFYRCIRDKNLFPELISRLDITLHSREEYVWCKETWEHDELDILERAARWYYCAAYSFAGVGRTFGRTKTTASIMSGKISEKLKYFQDIHERFRYVQVENLDWRQMLTDYDSHDTVFYVDPPYYGKNTYKHEFTKDDHIELCKRIFNCQGFVALSGYDNEIYNRFPWDAKHSWKAHVTATTRAITTQESNVTRIGLSEAEECLWVKEFESTE